MQLVEMLDKLGLTNLTDEEIKLYYHLVWNRGGPTMIVCDICRSDGAKYGYSFRMTPPDDGFKWETNVDLCGKCWEKFDHNCFRNNIIKSFIDVIEAGRRANGGGA